MKTIIHVNKHVIGKNNRHGSNDAPISIRKGRNGKAENVHMVEVLGPCKIIHSQYKPLRCGAKVWIETEAMVRVF